MGRLNKPFGPGHDDAGDRRFRPHAWQWESGRCTGGPKAGQAVSRGVGDETAGTPCERIADSAAPAERLGCAVRAPGPQIETPKLRVVTAYPRANGLRLFVRHLDPVDMALPRAAIFLGQRHTGMIVRNGVGDRGRLSLRAGCRFGRSGQIENGFARVAKLVELFPVAACLIIAIAAFDIMAQTPDMFPKLIWAGAWLCPHRVGKF